MLIDRDIRSWNDAAEDNRADRRQKRARIELIDHVIERYEERIDASRSASNRQLLSHRRQLVLDERQLVKMELAQLETQWANLLTRGKLSGFVTDRDIARWQAADHDI